MTTSPRTPQVAPDERDPLHHRSRPGLHWTTSNVGEAIPGVVTPLCWSIWGPGGERGLREAAFELGILTAAERRVPPAVEDRWVRPFYGRVALQVEFMALVADRMPGTTGEEAVTGVFGRIPEGMSFAPTHRRYPAIAVGLPRTFIGFPRRLSALAPEMDAWWGQSIRALDSLDRRAALSLLIEADSRFNQAETLQTISVFGVVQPMFDALSRLIARAGVGELGTLSGTGGAEMDVVADIWRASRGEIGPGEVLVNHGFHGPREGELSSVVWREDPGPVERMIEQYAARPASEDPIRIERQREPERLAMEREVLRALPRRERPAARVVLRAARRRIPLRGFAKRSFLQALDVARGAARRLGEHMAVDGELDDVDDVFYLTLNELPRLDEMAARELVSLRRARRAEYQRLVLPGDWRGMPEVTVADEPAAGGLRSLAGVGVSPGSVEGVARVVADPDFAAVEPGEILVASTTDPSWASIMFISAGLVVDIGGPLSHAAVVARELGIPCVVNTRNGTAVLRDGDRVRVDGTAGTVDVLERAGPPADESNVG